jgi:hypothetical protein
MYLHSQVRTKVCICISVDKPLVRLFRLIARASEREGYACSRRKSRCMIDTWYEFSATILKLLRIDIIYLQLRL